MVKALSLVALLLISTLSSKAHAYEQTVTLNYPTPIELRGSSYINISNELRSQGQDSVLIGDKIVKSVRVYAKSAFCEGQMALDIGINRVAYARVPQAYGSNYDYDSSYSFASIDLINNELVGRPYEEAVVSTSGQMKISRIEVVVMDKPVLTTQMIESFHLAVGQPDQEKKDVNFYGPIQCVKLSVENHDVTITEFVVENLQGDKERISELEGSYQQETSRKYCYPDQAQKLSRIIVRGSTNPNNDGRAKLKLHISSWN